MKPTHAEKLSHAIAYLRSKGRYVLDAGSTRPAWGTPHEVPTAPNAAMLARETQADRRRVASGWLHRIMEATK